LITHLISRKHSSLTPVIYNAASLDRGIFVTDPAPATDHTVPGPQGNIANVLQRIGSACEKCGRDAASVTLLAVSKTRSANEVRAAFAAGLTRFGENYVQEADDKITALADLDIEWHFIGPLQSNKTRTVAERMHWVHSVDRPKVAERLAAQRPAGMAPLNVCIQVHIGDEATKSGCDPQDVNALARVILGLPQLKLRGLMAIPPPETDPAKQRTHFAQLTGLLRQLRADFPDTKDPDATSLDTLSMGMSDDLEAAICEGATLVRIGTALFGPRPENPRKDQ